MFSVSKYFLMGRLTYAHHKEGQPDTTVEPVAPAIRSIEAFEQLKDLRKMSRDGKNDPEMVFHLDPERRMAKVIPAEVAKKGLKDLRVFLCVTDGEVEYIPFAVANPKKGEKEAMILNMDYTKSGWKLESQIIEKQ